MAEVRLVDLELIKRYSLAVRRDTVDATELLRALDASRATVLAALGQTPSGDGVAPDAAGDAAFPLKAPAKKPRTTPTKAQTKAPKPPTTRTAAKTRSTPPAEGRATAVESSPPPGKRAAAGRTRRPSGG